MSKEVFTDENKRVVFLNQTKDEIQALKTRLGLLYPEYNLSLDLYYNFRALQLKNPLNDPIYLVRGRFIADLLGYSNARTYENRFFQIDLEHMKTSLAKRSAMEVQKQLVTWKDGKRTSERFYTKQLAEALINRSRKTIAPFVKFYLRDCFKQLKKNRPLNVFDIIWDKYQEYHTKEGLMTPFTNAEFQKLIRKVQLHDLETKATFRELQDAVRQLTIKVDQVNKKINGLIGGTY